MVSDAEVCCTNTVSRPSRTPSPATQSSSAPVISYSPLPRVGTSIWCRNCASGTLFDSDALAQVARLIHVATAPHGDVIRQQLQRHDFQNRAQQRQRRRNLDGVVRHLGHLFEISRIGLNSDSDGG